MSFIQRLYSCCVVLFLTTQAGLSFQISLVDDLDRTVSLPSPAQRVVSLAPSITETLFAVGAGDQVAGVTDYCNYPEEAKHKPRVGGIVNPSMEAIISLKPDLIILSMEGNVREDFSKLLSFGIPVFVTNPRTLAGIYKSIYDIGMLTGYREQASQLVHTMQAREESVRSAAQGKKRKVLFIVSLQPLIVVGSKTFLAELIDLAGGLNIAGMSVATYPTYSREAVVAENPEILFLMSDVPADPHGLVNLYPEWKQTDAEKNGNVFSVNADIVSRPGPRAIDGLETLFHFLHGEQK